MRLPLLLICLCLRQKLYKADLRCTRNIRFTRYHLYFCLSEIHICIAARSKMISQNLQYHSAPPFYYPADSSDNAKGGI